MKETNAGVACVNADDVTNFLMVEYARYKSNPANIFHKTTNAQQYSRKNQTKILASLLEKYLSN